MKKSLFIIPMVILVLMMSLIAVASAAYGQSVVAYAGIEDGFVSNPNGILGSSPDDSYARLYGGNLGDGGVIDVYMSSTVSSGAPVYLYSYSAPGYYSHVYVYVSYDNSNWHLVGSGYVYPDDPGWLYCGDAPITYRYIGIAAYDDEGWSANFYIDCIYSA
jgi:hypothetical protein